MRSFLINAAALWAVSQVISGVVFGRGYETLLVAAVVLGLVNLFIRPLINIMILPINLLTLGAFRWIVNVATLFLVTLLVPGFKIVAFNFPGATFQGFTLPAVYLGAILALILVSFLLSLFSSLLFWLIK